MSWRKMLGLAVFLLALPLTVYAAERRIDDGDFEGQAAATLQWEWPDFGLTFEYPSDWQPARQQGFDFLLVAPAPTPEEANFMGMQSALLAEGETVQTYFDLFAESYQGTVEATTLGGREALSLELPTDESGRRALLIGFSPDDESIALMIFSGLDSDWEMFSTQAQAIIASAEVKPLELDVAELDAELQASFAENQILQLGDPEAPITIVEVMDFSCSHCVDYSRSVARLVQDYVLTGEVRLEFKFVTFVGGEFSQTATHAQFCAADQGVAWQAHKALFKLYLSNGGAQAYTESNIKTALEGLLPDSEAFAACLSDKTFSDLIARNQQEADALGVESTPSLLVAQGDGTPTFIEGSNGEPLRGGVSLIFLYGYLDDLLGE